MTHETHTPESERASVSVFDTERQGRSMKLLVGLDVHSSNDDALFEAFAFSTLFPKSKVEVLWAAPLSVYPPELLETTQLEDLPTPDEMLRDRVLQAVKRFGQEKLIDAATEMSLLIGHGSPTKALEETAFVGGTDMIIVAARDQEKGALESILTGSVTRKLVKTAPCPVLVTRPKVSEAVPKVESDTKPAAERRIGLPHRYASARRNQTSHENMPLLFPM